MNLFNVQFIGDTGWVSGDDQFFRKTTNGGATWNAVTGLPSSILGMHFLNPRLGWAVGSGSPGFLLKTTDGGASWTNPSTAPANLWSVFMLDSLSAWAVGEKGVLTRTTNGGASWTTPSSGTSVWLHRIFFLDAATGWFLGHNGLIRKTTNGGSTWVTQATVTTQHLISISVRNADTAWCSGWGGTILKTTNGGSTWIAQSSGTQVNLNSIGFQDANTGYAWGDNGFLLKTTNGGTNWVAQASGITSTVTSIQFTPAATWLTGFDGGFFKASNSTLASFSYPVNPAVLGVGTPSAPNTPRIQGATPITFSILPELPAGLSFSPSTGAVSGTPTAPSPATDYVVSATNAYGSIAAILKLGVVTPPSGLSYSVFPAPVYSTGMAITPNVPAVSGTVTRYSVSPPLPAGLLLDTVTGVISGTPTAPAAPENYTITASNAAGGSTSAVLNITVLLKPVNLSYSANPGSYRAGTAITPNAPSIQGSTPLTYSVDPALPPGLTLNPGTGIISGTPSAQTASAYYTVTASNSAGSTICILSLAVASPSALSPIAHRGRAQPFRAPGVSLAFEIPPAARAVRLEIRTPRGERVWEDAQAAGSPLAWDGKGFDGARWPSGLYSLRLTWLDGDRRPAGSASRRFLYVAP